MKILSFNKAKQDELVRKSLQARGRRRYREAYDFLREALRYGEDAVILSRAAELLNEMGEHGGALQLATLAIAREKNCAPARWELGRALERCWDIEEAIEVLSDLDESVFPELGYTLFLCHLKNRDAEGARRRLFRLAHRIDLPIDLKARCDRLESAGRTELTLRDWKWIMHGHRLAHERGPHAFPAQPFARSFEKGDFDGYHYVVGEPAFGDCARVLLDLETLLGASRRAYSGILPLGERAIPVALFLSRLMDLPAASVSQAASDRPLLLVMGSNLDGSQPGRHWPIRHDLLVFMKSFECDEFYDTVAPPHNVVRLGAWAPPMAYAGRQFIGALGEALRLPWERKSRTPPDGQSLKEAPPTPSGWEQGMRPEEAADRLWDAYQLIKKG